MPVYQFQHERGRQYYNAPDSLVKLALSGEKMLDGVSEIFGAVADALFGDWYRQQSALTRALIWILIVTVVLGILYFLFPSVLGFVSNTR